MTNQQIVDHIENELPYRLPEDIKEKILDAVWNVLNDNMGVDLEVPDNG
jgi:hypothetical protein